VIRHVRVHRADDRDVINAPGDVGEQIADFDAALAVIFKLEWRLKRRAGAALGFEIVHRQRLAVEFGENRFGIKRVNVRRSAIGKNVNDALGLARKMRGVRRQRTIACHFVSQRARAEQVRAEQLRQPQHAEAHSTATEKIPAREEAILQLRLMMWCWHA
jgi:hypothetical protein